MSNDRDQEPEHDDVPEPGPTPDPGREPAQEPGPGPGPEPAPEPAEQEPGMGAMTWVFLPIGFTFLILGLTQGIGDGGGTAFFVIGVTFVVLALTTGGVALGATLGTAGGRRRPDGPEAGSDADGEPGGTAGT